jgi:hypothetical protein
MPEQKRCVSCGGWMTQDKKLFNVLRCHRCGNNEYGRLNSVVAPQKEKRGVVASAWDRITRL